MGMGRMRAGRVSRTCPSLDDAVADPRERDLSDASYPYIRFDATYIKCGDGGRARSTAPVAAVGAGSCGHVRPLGLDARVGDAELHRPHDRLPVAPSLLRQLLHFLGPAVAGLVEPPVELFRRGGAVRRLEHVAKVPL